MWGGWTGVVECGAAPFAGGGGEEPGGGCVWGCEGRKDIDSVPEKRTTLTARATGSTAVKGLG